MERLCTKENALQAIFEINKERKRNKTAQWVERTKEERALELCKIVHDFRPKPPKTFTCYAPTLKPVLMGGMDYYCCGSIPGRGPHRAKRAIEKWIDKDRKGTKYSVEADIKKYYDTPSPRTVQLYAFYIEKSKNRQFYLFRAEQKGPAQSGTGNHEISKPSRTRAKGELADILTQENAW